MLEIERLKAVIIGVVLVIFTLIFFLFHNASEMTRAALSRSDYEGQITKGTKFGLTVGDKIPDVTQALERHGLYYDETYSVSQHKARPNECHEYEYSNITHIMIFADNSWRRGTICVIARNDSMVAMSWVFQPGSP